MSEKFLTAASNNVDVSRMGNIASESMQHTGGDSIDHGLWLIRRMAEYGYHVVKREDPFPCGCTVDTGTHWRERCGCLSPKSTEKQ